MKASQFPPQVMATAAPVSLSHCNPNRRSWPAQGSPPSSGKEACRHLHRTRYIRMPNLLEELNLAMETGHSIASEVTKLSNYQLLIIDEWLLDIPSEEECKYLLEIFERRYTQWPTIFCSQYKTGEWHPRLGGGVVADAILDRIIHNSITINTGSLNMREFLAAHPM